MAKDFKTRFIPLQAEKDSVREKPFSVAFERGGNYSAGDRLSRDEFDEVLENYDAVVVHWNSGEHPSSKQHFLLYGEAEQALDADPHIDTVEKRERSHEITGKFRWFSHGRELAVETTIGLHCLSDEVWEELP
ncbi:MAG: hypothetical protein ABEI07_00730 [Candidatus Nanohaloarchaea archaeon]